jgi:hypothetical protein
VSNVCSCLRARSSARPVPSAPSVVLRYAGNATALTSLICPSSTSRMGMPSTRRQVSSSALNANDIAVKSRRLTDSTYPRAEIGVEMVTCSPLATFASFNVPAARQDVPSARFRGPKRAPARFDVTLQSSRSTQERQVVGP